MVGENPEYSDRETRPNATDIHVGSRIRLRRILLKMSQERLGHALGLTFQQVQKYERGTNRVGASRLFDIARILEVPISYFFDDMTSLAADQKEPNSSVHGKGFAEPAARFNEGIDQQLARRETIDLIQAYYRIVDPAVRSRMLELIKSMGPSPKKSSEKG